MDRRNMLDFMLNARLEEIGRLNKYDLAILNDHFENNAVFQEFQNYVEGLNLPLGIRNKLSDYVFALEGSNSEELSYFNEKYYKAGFSDAVNLIFDAKEYKKDGEK